VILDKEYPLYANLYFCECVAFVSQIEPKNVNDACMCNFKFHQMDVKSEFLNSFLNEEGYVSLEGSI